jgi:hypothetical protein
LALQHQYRSTGGTALSEVLQALDIPSDARNLTLASSNDAATLDKAAIHTERFDSVVEIGFPSALAQPRSGGANRRPTRQCWFDLRGGDRGGAKHTSGSDIREIVRRAGLSGDGRPIRPRRCLPRRAAATPPNNGRDVPLLPTT